MYSKASTLSKEPRQSLSPDQREIVIAPPGCGKTELLAKRLVDAISGRAKGGAIPPEKILCITFTDQAAAEMNERVKRELSKQMKGAKVTLPTICTLHAYCLRELRQKQWEASKTSIQIIDERRQGEFSAVSGLSDLNRTNYHSDRAEIPLSKVVKGAFTLAQGKKIRFSKNNQKPIREYWRNKYLEFVDKYITYKKELNEKGSPDRYLDFNDVLLEARDALSSGEWEHPFSLVFVDEVQDLSSFQLDLISMLVSPDGHICYFGDPQQAIYSFMGARVQKLVSLWKSCGEKNRSFRRINYRSPAHILSLLNKYAHNRIRIDQEWESFCKNWEQLPSAKMKRTPRPDYGIPLTYNEDLGEEIALIHKESREAELEAICEMIDTFDRSESNAILTIRNDTVDWIMGALKEKRKYILFDSSGDTHSYYMRFLRAHLRLCRHPEWEPSDNPDSDKESRPFYGDVWAEIIPFLLGCEGRMDSLGFIASLKEHSVSPLDILRGKDLPGAEHTEGIPFQETCGIKIFTGVLQNRYAPLFRKGQAALAALQNASESELNAKVSDFLGAAYAGLVKAGFLPPHQKKQWYTVQRMITKALKDASLTGIGQRLDLVERLLKETDPVEVIKRTATDIKIVHIMTVHKAKGRGFDNVFLFSADQQHYRPRNDEHDRVFFVGMSRARKRLVFSYSDPEINPFEAYFGKTYKNHLKDMSFIPPENRDAPTDPELI